MAIDLATAYITILPSTSGLAPEIRKDLAKKMPGVGRSSGKKLGSSLASAMTKATKVGLIAVGAATGVALLAGFKAAVNRQKSEAALKGLYGSAKDAKRIMKDLRKVSQSSSIDYSSYTEAAQSLAYIGVAAKDSAPMLKNMGKMIVGAGGDSQNLRGANEALLNMVNTGKVLSRDLEVMSRNKIPVFGSLATKYFGDESAGSMEKLRKKIHDGGVSIEDVTEVMSKATGKTANKQKKASEEIEKTWSATWARTKDNVKEAFGDLVGAGSVLDKLAPALDKVGKAVTTFIEQLSTGKGAGGKFVDALKQIRDFMQPVFDTLSKHKELFGKLALGLGVLTVAVGLFNIVMGANVVLVVALALAALVVAVVTAYDHFETFRTIVDAVWAGIKIAFTAAWALIKPILTLLGNVISVVLPIAFNVLKTIVNVVFTAVGLYIKVWWALAKAIFAAAKATLGVLGVAFNLFKAVVSAVFTAAKTAIQVAWAAIKIVFGALKTGIGGVGDKFSWLYENVIKPVAKWIGDKITWLWENAIKPVLIREKKGLQALGDKFSWLYENVVKPVMGWIGSKISDVWNDGIKPVFSALKSGVKAVGTAFGAAKDAIGKAWKKIQEKAKAPVVFVVDHVINPLIGGINALIPGKGPLTKIDRSGWSSGGYTGNLPARQVAGAVHGNEHVIKATSRKSIEGSHPGVLDYMNKTGRIPGYASGGHVWPVGGVRRQHTTGYPWARWAGDMPVGTGTSVKAYADGVVSSVKHMATSYGNHIRINHGAMKTLYAHLQSTLVSVGQKVKAGQVIGKSDSTGNSTGPHLHFEIAGGSDAIDAGGGGFSLPKWLSSAGGMLSRAMGKMGGLGKGGFFKDGLHRLIKDIIPKVYNGVKGKLGDLVHSALSKLGIGNDSSVSGRWGDLVKKSLAANGLPQTDAYVGAWLKQIKTESGGNPTARQGIIDVNSFNGSGGAKGLLQTIPATFAAYKKSGHNEIFNGYDNMLAAMNYAKHRYGAKGMLSVIGHGHGYANGTLGAKRGLAWVGERGPELVNFRGGEQVRSNSQSQALANGFGNSDEIVQEIRGLRADLADGLGVQFDGMDVIGNHAAGLMHSRNRRSV